jgi:hypothetical protein
LPDRAAAALRGGSRAERAERAEAPVDAAPLAAALQPLLAAAARDALAWLYPAAPWPAARGQADGPIDGRSGSPPAA